MSFFNSGEFEQLLRQARAGSREDLGQLLQRVHGNLLSLSKSIVPAALLVKIDRGELIQETLTGAVSDFPAFRGASEPEFLVWLRSIMRTRAMNMARSDTQARRRVAPPRSLHEELAGGILAELIPDDAATPYTSTNRAERRQIMLEALATLKPDYQAVVNLHFFQGKSFPEIAALLDKKVDAIDKTWRRALQAWRQALNERGLTDS